MPFQSKFALEILLTDVTLLIIVLYLISLSCVSNEGMLFLLPLGLKCEMAEIALNVSVMVFDMFVKIDLVPKSSTTMFALK